MKIGLLLGSGSLSGAEKRVVRLANDLLIRGYDVTLLMEESVAVRLKAFYSEEEFPPLLTFREPLFLRWIGRGYGRFRMVRTLAGLDLIETKIGKWWWSSQAILQRCDVVHVFLQPRFLRFISSVAIFEVTSPDVAKYLQQSKKLIPETVILRAVSASVQEKINGCFPKNTSCPALLPYFKPPEFSEPNFGNKSNTILFASRFQPRKNALLFAKVVKRFLVKRPDWKVLIRGWGPLQDQLEEILCREVESGSVDIGFNPDIWSELLSSRVFISLIEEDNYPSQSVLEAMWAGCALLLSNRGESKAKFIKNNGLVCELEEEDVLESLISITQNIEALTKAGKCSREIVRTRFAPEVYLNELVGLYSQALVGRS